MIMKIKKIFLISIILSLCYHFSSAQETKSENLIAFINPQYLLINGIRFDIEFRKPESNKWWVISPYYYSDGSSNSILSSNWNPDLELNEYENMYGAGLGVARKMFLKSSPTANGVYAMVRFTYNYFNIKGDNLAYVQTTDSDGLQYYQIQDLEYTININSYQGSVILGKQFNPFSKFYFDLYMGLGLKYSTHESPEKVATTFNRGMIDYGYSGTQFIGGFRFGVSL